MDSDSMPAFWADAAIEDAESVLSPREKELRAKFVEEYLYDYDAVAAAIRIGFAEAFAVEYARQFLTEPYVLKLIKERESAGLDDPDEDEILRRRVKRMLLREANLQGKNARHSARVAAITKLANILEMDGAVKMKQEVTHRGGVMMVPGIADLDEWEQAATESQEKLMRDARSDIE